MSRMTWLSDKNTENILKETQKHDGQFSTMNIDDL